ncbi:NADH-quinone oxidoreductase subunit NuoN [Scleromatobacter humisilvae]|uniref:NADH-quinone oxidoreductase subunit N n=1 Tax=Scleromatobacter humisilvae TaxID=2897159 RepID=A0A9X1YJK0_9BURK|nr:NADH-quinone oxidoreductase subunit NuoN [Scleromatobacter humisilvae]MCK9685963.1 NADH-quinone oxidoreductase subunit NuoN [Scleromatobacter humisilvae]
MSHFTSLPIYPEIFLLLMTSIVTLLGVGGSESRQKTTYIVAQVSLGVLALMHLDELQRAQTVYAMQRMVVIDPLGHLLALAGTLATMITLGFSRPYLASRDLLKGEFLSLAMFSLLGISVMVSANNFLVVYVGLELMSLSLYALTALRRDHAVSTEAAMKYFILGALASGFLLYGLSMMYGATGTLDIPTVFEAIHKGTVNPQVLTFGLVFIVAGLGFKLGLAPFHMWVPDVYQGAPTAVTLLISGAPKLAAFGITFRILVEGLSGLATDWQQMLIVLSVVSMTLGNLAAIAQSNLKRLLAYSAIAQLGFMLLGFTPTVVNMGTAAAANGYSSALFYIVTYVLTTLGTFGLIMVLSRHGFESEEISDLAGLGKRSPWIAGVMALFMFSLAGIPPLVGFYAKFAVLQALVSTGVKGYIILAVVAVLLSLVGAYYYLRIVKTMFFDEPADTTPIRGEVGATVLLALNGLAALGFGLLPDGLMTACREAVIKAIST